MGFTIKNGVLIKYTGKETEITVPDGVTAIGKDAFSKHEQLTGVTLPLSVTAIEEYAFYGCTNLTRVSTLYSIMRIHERAFCNCTAFHMGDAVRGNAFFTVVEKEQPGSVCIDRLHIIPQLYSKEEREALLKEAAGYSLECYEESEYEGYPGSSKRYKEKIKKVNILVKDGHFFGCRFEQEAVSTGGRRDYYPTVVRLSNNSFDTKVCVYAEGINHGDTYSSEEKSVWLQKRDEKPT